MPNLAETLTASAGEVASLGASVDEIELLDDASLLEGQRLIAGLQRAIQPYAIATAAAIARRSSGEFGYSGLAKKNGFVSPVALIQSLTGATKIDATKLVQLGTMVSETRRAEVEPRYQCTAPWQSPIAAAVAAGQISLDAADSIRRGLSGVDDVVATEDLHAAAAELVAESATVSADALFRRARELRDELDSAGVARRERERRELRYFTAKRRPDGLIAGSYLLSDEDGELMLSIHDRATSPRSGGPRFVDPVAAAETDALLADHRSNGQIVADTIVSLLRLAIDADDGAVFGTRRPTVRVLVTQKARTTRTGFGVLEGGAGAVSLDTIDRLECESGIVGVLFDGTRPLDVGRDQRTFTSRQRVALAARDGGCRFPNCERPVSWTEAHHINHWVRDHGESNVEDGILLCRTHHMLIHDNHWRILRRPDESGSDGYWLEPPRQLDSAQRLRPMPSRSRALRELQRA